MLTSSEMGRPVFFLLLLFFFYLGIPLASRYFCYNSSIVYNPVQLAPSEFLRCDRMAPRTAVSKKRSLRKAEHWLNDQELYDDTV